jgi:glyoxylase-like metal-dependent hydrolase (beta-lactamase superfamily II)
MFTGAIDIAEIQPGVLRLRLPSWQFGAEGVNVWLLRDSFDTPHGRRLGWTVLDTGPDTPHVRALWQAVFERHLDGLPLLRVCVTRAQPDNAGLARWLCEWWSAGAVDCQLWISAGEFYAAHRAAQSVSLGVELAVQLAASHGVHDAAALDGVRGHALAQAHVAPQLPNRFRRLVAGRGITLGWPDQQRVLTCLVGWGHSVEAMSLYCHQSQTLYAGDMLCPDTPTTVGVTPDDPEADAVHLLLDSLESLRDLPPGVTLYSARGQRQVPLSLRVSEMQAYCAAQLAAVLTACGGGPTTAHALTLQLPLLASPQPGMTQPQPQPPSQPQPQPLAPALSTAIACLNALWHARLLERESRQGVWWFWVRG